MALKCAPVQACPLIIPSAVDLPARDAGQALQVKVECPTGQPALTRGAWSARLARVDGGQDDQAQPQSSTILARAAFMIIPEPECPRRRQTSSLGYEPYDERLRRLGQSLAGAQ
jgi:hypothetical protein